LALVALKDPLRENIKDSLGYAPMSGITLRMVSGDNVDTARAVAVDVGILTMEEYNGSAHLEDQKKFAMDAKEFREQVGEVIKSEQVAEDGQEPTFTYSLTNQQRFNQIIGTLKVIGRAEPQDKLRLVAGLRGMREHEDDENSGRKVAVVGEGINDIEAFRAANVSFAVAGGASYARNNASMVLQTSDFDSCMRAVMWGRNIYMNVQRFL
jgi:magnesium-transporting ATPase (P-type)